MKSLGKAPSKAARKNYSERTEFFDGKKFHNTEDFPAIVKTKETDQLKISLKKGKPVDSIPLAKPDFSSVPDDQINVTWFGHSSVLMQAGGLYLLFDPIFSKMISPVSWIGIKRYSDLPFDIDELPEIDILFLSHDHYDHLDYKTILKLDKKVKKYAVPLGVESHLEYWKIDRNKIVNFAWWESAEISGIRITSTPGQHFSGRAPWSMSSTWWTSWVIETSSRKIFINGDSGYSDHYKQIQKRFGGFDFALMECGQYGIKWPKLHMFPEETVKAAVELNAKTVMPMHWGSVNLAENGWDDSAERFVKAIADCNLPYATPLIGQTFNPLLLLNPEFDKNQLQSKWWKEIR